MCLITNGIEYKTIIIIIIVIITKTGLTINSETGFTKKGEAAFIEHLLFSPLDYFFEILDITKCSPIY